MSIISKIDTKLSSLPGPYEFYTKTGEVLYKEQISHLGSAIILDDYDPNVVVKSFKLTVKTPLIFPDGSLISGSFAMHILSKLYNLGDIKYNDTDIYFKSRDDAQLFAEVNKNKVYGFDFSNPMCAYGICGGDKLNLIYGVEYKSPADLISKFDIRACSVAIDINSNLMHAVAGSLMDIIERRITFNPVPRGVTVRRLAKYIKKNFEIDKYQSIFFAELLRSSIYSPELELMTKEY